MSQPMTKSDLDQMVTLGALNPVNHVILAFADDATAASAVQVLLDDGYSRDAILTYTSRELFPNLADMVRNASGAAGFGYEVVLMRRYMALATEGSGWLIVHAPDDVQAEQLKAVAKRFDAKSAVRYGRLVHEDLI